jgi:hypothetical protein
MNGGMGENIQGNGKIIKWRVRVFLLGYYYLIINLYERMMGGNMTVNI